MKFQWSIQSSHTQPVLSQVVYLNYRNEYIWSPTRKWLHIFEAFNLASLQFETFDHFFKIFYLYISFWDRYLKFLIFQFDEQLLVFWASYIFNISRFPFFLSNTHMCDRLLQLIISFSFWDLHLVSYIAKKNK